MIQRHDQMQSQSLCVYDKSGLVLFFSPDFTRSHICNLRLKINQQAFGIGTSIVLYYYYDIKHGKPIRIMYWLRKWKSRNKLSRKKGCFCWENTAEEWWSSSFRVWVIFPFNESERNGPDLNSELISVQVMVWLRKLFTCFEFWYIYCIS